MFITKEKNSYICKNRAWVEINLDNLEHNISEIRKIIYKDCKIMAVVKANAYGHGMVEISEKLLELGIDDFAVATLDEGIYLRKNGITGNILILGYTSLKYVDVILKYDLIQTIVDYDYATEISKLNISRKLKAHLKINTGMNRIGEDYNQLSNIQKIYKMDNIRVLGIFTHLSVADSSREDDIQFTKCQIDKFYNLILALKKQGYPLGKIHLQSSYGLLNYPELRVDYVRTGIIMYGIHSDKNIQTKVKLDLKPVLSLKARITSIRNIQKGDFVGYGRTYLANCSMRIATVSVGYADGYPRDLSLKRVKVFVRNQYAEVIGRICMDQLMIDISNIENIKVGDIVTLIGNRKLISAERVASNSKTITNELLSRLGSRLEYITITSKKKTINKDYVV